MVEQTESKNRIKHLNAELTRVCNLRCNYCFNDSGKRMVGELDQEQWKKVIEVSKEYGAESILFTGGEVTLRSDADKIVAYAIEHGLRTSILTNGAGIRSEEYADVIKDLERVQISLDSADHYRHDRRRGFGSWQDARNTIDYVRGVGTDVEISITVGEETLDELEGVVDIACNTGSKVLIRPLQKVGRAKWYDDRNNIINAIEERKRRLEERVGNIFVEDFARYVPILGENHDEVVMRQGYITILPDGKMRGVGQNFLKLQKAA